jgi:hypothetical protein
MEAITKLSKFSTYKKKKKSEAKLRATEEEGTSKTKRKGKAAPSKPWA